MNIYQKLVQPFVDYFNEGAFFENDFAVAGVLTAVVSVVLMKLRVFPERIWGRIKRYLYYSVTIEQNDMLYNLVCQYIDNEFPDKVRRSIAVTKPFVTKTDIDFFEDEEFEGEVKCGGDKILYTPLVDSFFVVKRGLYINKKRDKLDNAGNHDMVYFNKIVISGFMAKRRIQKLIEDCYSLKPKETGEVKEFVTEFSEYWGCKNNFMGCAVKKSSDTIFFPEKAKILEAIDVFQNSREKYERAHVDWYMGVLLHGRAGSGKTTFARSLAKYTNRNLYTLNLSSMKDDCFKKLFHNIGANAILLLDDVDICLNGRDDKNEGVSLSTLLSCLDGNDSRGDLIVILTTNRIEVLDEALIRKGRIDLIEEVSYPDRKSVEDFLNYFYNKTDLVIEDGVIDFSMVEVQHICLNNEDVDEGLSKVNGLLKNS